MLVTGCGSSSSSAADPGPTASTEAASAPASDATEATASDAPTEAVDTPSETPSDESSAPSANEFTDASTGVSLTVPDGYVLVTSSAEAAEKLPDALKATANSAAVIEKIKQSLDGGVSMVALQETTDGPPDNISLGKGDADELSNPADITTTTFQDKVRDTVTQGGATDVQVEAAEVGGKPAVHATYSLTSGTTVLAGQQYYIASGDKKILVLTISAGTADRAQEAATAVVDSTKFA